MEMVVYKNLSGKAKKSLDYFQAPVIYLFGDVTGLFLFTGKCRIFCGGEIVRVKITLACTECKQRNYDTTKEKRNHPDRMELRKYCRFCRKHTVHKETK